MLKPAFLLALALFLAAPLSHGAEPREGCSLFLSRGQELSDSHVPRAIGGLVDMERVREDLDVLTGRTPLPNGHVLVDRFTEENREETRKFLRTRLESLGFRTSIESFGESVIGTRHLPSGANVIGELVGPNATGEFVEISAHFDTRDHGIPGADDNGSGLVAALEMAAVFRSVSLERPLRIVFSDLEERGKPGMREHVRLLEARGEKIRGSLVIDMIGYYPKDRPREFVLEVGVQRQYKPGSSNANEAHAASREMAEAILYQYRLYDDRGTRIAPLTYEAAPATADHGPYWDRGYPALLAAAPYVPGVINPNYHKTTDVIEAINWEYLEDIIRTMTEGVACLGGAQLACEAQTQMLAARASEYDARLSTTRPPEGGWLSQVPDGPSRLKRAKLWVAQWVNLARIHLFP